MTLSDDLYTALSPIVAIGGPGAPRIYRTHFKQHYTLPALTFFRVDTVFEYAHDGDADLIHPRYQVSCWAATNNAADTLAATVKTTLDAWLAIGSRVALPVNQYDLTDPETGVHQIALDFVIWFNT